MDPTQLIITPSTLCSTLLPHFDAFYFPEKERGKTAQRLGLCEKMLRKRERSIQKDQHMDLSGQRQKTHSFFNVPGLFVGLSPKSVLDCDSVRSPTSPLDFKLLGTSFRDPNPKPSVVGCGNQKCWECNKLGLGCIVDSLDDCRTMPEKIMSLSNTKSKTILFGLQIRSKTPNSATLTHFCEASRSLPESGGSFPRVDTRDSSIQKGSSYVSLESNPFEKIRSFSLDSKILGSEIYRVTVRNAGLGTNSSCLGKLTSDSMPLPSGNEISQPLTPRDIELSEDYTCVISHGSNPKTTHIFCDCVLERHPNGFESENKQESSDNVVPFLEIPSPLRFPPIDFLSNCHSCKKKLEEGKDIYMYRGEKAFCSSECRMEEISIEEKKEKSICEAFQEYPNAKNGDNFSENSVFFAI